MITGTFFSKTLSRTDFGVRSEGKEVSARGEVCRSVERTITSYA